MQNRYWWAIFFLLGIIFLDQVVFADMTLFDFNQLPTNPRRRANNYVAVESYMEGLLGSDTTVSQGTTAVKDMGNLGNSDMNLAGGLGASITTPDAFLLNGKGKNSGLVISFGGATINSFAVDWEVFKKGTGIIIKADGVVIYQDLLTKSERKTGIVGHLSPVYLNTPIHTLEFIGVKNSRLGIDNLAVNIPLPNKDNGNQSSGSTSSEPGGGGSGGGGAAAENNQGDHSPAGDGLQGQESNQEHGNDYSGDGTESGEHHDDGDSYPRGWDGNHDNGGPYRHESEHQVPEPGTFILFGVGLLAIGAFGRFMAPARFDG